MALIVKPNTFTAGAVIIAAEHNSNFDTVYNDYNGNISDANIVSNASISLSKLSLSDDVAFTGDVNFNNSATTDNIVDIAGNSLTTGIALNISSSSTSTASRAIEKIDNSSSAATGTVGLLINNAGGPHVRLTGDPTVASPTDGDIWYTGSALNFRDGSVTKNIIPTVSVQRGIITITSTASATATITAVDTSGTSINVLGFTSDVNSNNGFPYVALTNPTTVTATRLDTSASATIVSFEAITST